MVSQPPNEAGGKEGRDQRGNAGAEFFNMTTTTVKSASARSNRPSSKARGQDGGGVSFVAFDAGISKEARKAVRVQAAKASAATRKATIARKLAAQKQNQGTTDEHQLPTEQVSVVQSRNPPVKHHQKPKETPNKPRNQALTLAPIVSAEPTLQLPSPSASSTHSSRLLSDTENDCLRISRPTTPSAGAAHLCPRHSTIESPREPCTCHIRERMTPPTSVENSPRLGNEYKMDRRENVETAQALEKYSFPRPGRISVGRHDPFNCYPVQWQPWYDRLLHYMMTVFAPRAWPLLRITASEGVRWECFMTQHAMEEPALFYVRLLFASGDLVRIGALNRECSYWLQSQAIQSINEALSEKRRSVSDGLILAVGRIALHECMYGDRNAANTIHRPAQRRMIDMRGGMRNLGFPDLVKKLMRWSDRVMAMQGNTKRFLPDEEDQGNSTYGVQQSVDVFEAWAPETGQALRKKIAIADLLTTD